MTESKVIEYEKLLRDAMISNEFLEQKIKLFGSIAVAVNK